MVRSPASPQCVHLILKNFFGKLQFVFFSAILDLRLFVTNSTTENGEKIVSLSVFVSLFCFQNHAKSGILNSYQNGASDIS